MSRIKLWQAKLKAAKVEARQWIKARNQSERALARVGRQIIELEKKIDNKLAKAQ